MGLLSAPLVPFLVGEETVAVLASCVVAILRGAGAFGRDWDIGGPNSRDLERMKEPGSPSKGFSSMYSLLKREERPYDSASN